MKTLIFMITLAFLVPSQAQSLKEYRWKKRVLLLFSGNKLALQKSELTKESAGLEERDVVTLEADASARRQFEIKDGQFAILLFGKDGGEKFRSSDVVKAEKIFGIIDTMPMRKDEVRFKK